MPATALRLIESDHAADTADGFDTDGTDGGGFDDAVKEAWLERLAELSAAHGVPLPAAFVDAVATAVSVDFADYERFCEEDAARWAAPAPRKPALTLIDGGKAA
jgi:hypothetical protein